MKNYYLTSNLSLQRQNKGDSLKMGISALFFRFSIPNFFRLFIFLSGFLGAETGNDSVVFQRNYKEALQFAVDTKKSVLLDFYADWCEPCKEMDRKVLNQPTIAHFFNANFISIKIDGESKSGKQLMKKYQVSGFPTYIFINKKGKIVQRISGLMEAGQFLQMGRETVNPAESLYNLRKSFIENPQSREKMERLLTALSSEDISEISGILDYHHFRNPKIKLSIFWNDIKQYRPLNNSKSIRFVRKKINDILKVEKKEEVDAVLRTLCTKTMFWATRELDEKAFMQAREEYGAPTTREEKQSLDILVLEFYGRTDLEKFRKFARSLATVDWKGDWEVLNVLAEQYLDRSSKKEDWEEGLKLVEESISLKEAASNYDTKALLLKKLARNSDAILTARKAKELYDKSGESQNFQLRSLNLLLGN